MRVRRIKFYQYQRPFAFTFRTPHKTWRQAQSLIITVEFDNGINGWGESAPRDYVTGESPETVRRLFAEVFAPLLFDSEWDGAAATPSVLNRAVRACRKRGAGGYQSAIGALDLALFNAAEMIGAGRGLELIGSPVRDEFPRSLSVPILPCEQIAALFHELDLGAFRHIKVLMSSDKEENMDRTALVRRLFGPAADIRVEANGRWSYRQATDILAALQAYSISAVEQPLAPHRLKETARLRGVTTLPVILDEAVTNLQELQAVSEIGAGDIINIKVSKCGGLIRANQMASHAASLGLRCQLGAHVGESPILARAGALLAQRMPEVVYFEGCSYLLFEALLNHDSDGSPVCGQQALASVPFESAALQAHCRLIQTWEG